MTTGDSTRLQAAALPTSRLRAAPDSLVMALVVAFCTLPTLSQFVAAFPGVDEALLLTYAEQMLAGRLPVRDFYSVYGPGSVGTLAAIFGIAGPSVIAERTLGLAYHIAISTGVVRLTSPYGRAASCAAGIASALAMLPVGLVAYAWFGGLALVIWSLGLLIGPGRGRTALLAGVLGGLVSAWRIEMLVLLLAAAPLICRNGLARRYVKGLALGMAPMAAYVVVAGPQAFVDAVAGRLGLDARLSLTLPLRISLALLLAAVGGLGVVALARRTRSRVAVVYALLALLLLPQALQRTDTCHLVFVICLVGPLTVATVAMVRSRAGEQNVVGGPSPKGLVVLALATLVVTTAVWVVKGSASKTTEVMHSGRTVRVSTTAAPTLSAQLRLISNTVPRGSKIFVGAKDMSVPTNGALEYYYLLPEYRADSYYLELPADAAQRRDHALLNDVLQADALILTDVPRWYSRSLFPHMGRGVDEVDQAIASKFCPAGTVDPMTVYTRCDNQ